MVEHNLVGDHVSVQSDKIEDKASGMVSDQAVMALSSPREGCRDASRPPSIVGLMRNSLSEAPTLIVSFLVSTIGFFVTCLMRGTEYPRLYAALLFSCSPVKRTCAARSIRATTHALLFSCSPVKRPCAARSVRAPTLHSCSPVLLSKGPARYGVPAPLRTCHYFCLFCNKKRG